MRSFATAILDLGRAGIRDKALVGAMLPFVEELTKHRKKNSLSCGAAGGSSGDSKGRNDSAANAPKLGAPALWLRRP